MEKTDNIEISKESLYTTLLYGYVYGVLAGVTSLGIYLYLDGLFGFSLAILCAIIWFPVGKTMYNEYIEKSEEFKEVIKNE